MKNASYIIVFLSILAISTPGCKKVVLNCDYVVTPYIQQIAEVDDKPMNTVVGYAFYADTAQWAVTTYANAIEGTINNRLDNSIKEYDIKGERDQQGRLHFSLRNKRAIIIVCDPVSKIYAWRQIETIDNLDQILVKIRFRPWKYEGKYEEARWEMVNETPPIKPDTTQKDIVKTL